MIEEEIDGVGRLSAVSTDFNTVHDAVTPVARQTAPSRGARSVAPSPSASVKSTAASASTPVTPAAAAQPARQASAQDVQAAVNRANANLATYNRVLDYSVDAITGLTIATIRNSQTGAVVQQIPGPDMVHLAQMLANWSPGKNLHLDLLA